MKQVKCLANTDFLLPNLSSDLKYVHVQLSLGKL